MDVPPARATKLARFGLFEVDFDRRILSKGGLRVKLQDQPFRLLWLLLERPGEVVTRDEIRAKLWPANTFVEFDDGLNTAIKKLRTALGDSSENPQFIETVHRHGYRFLAPIVSLPGPQAVDRAHYLESRRGTTAEVIVARRGRITIELPVWKRRSVTAAVLLLCIGATWMLVRDLNQSREPLIIITPFTSFPGLEAYPSFSPDGKQIVFVWDGGDSGTGVDLYLKQAGNEVPRRLTNHPARYLVPAWSSDGEFVAFTRTDESGSAIYLIPALGGPERKLTDTATMYWLYGVLSWSADAKYLAYADVTETPDKAPIRTQIHLINVQTLEKRVLPKAARDCEATWVPSFSPDGKYLATSCVVSIGVQRIYIQSATGGTARQVTLFQGDFRGMTWSADSKFLIYSVDRWLWKIPAAGGTAEQLLFASDALQPAVSRTGHKLAYSQQTYSSFIWRLDLAAPDQPVRPPMKFIASSRAQEDPRISPDGKYVAFDSWRSGAPEVWVCNADGSNPVQLTSFQGPMTGTPRWSPDSQQLVFDSRATGQSQLYVVSRQGGPRHQLHTGTPSASEPFWSRDGKWIYFSDEKDEGIWKVQASGGSAIRLTDEMGLPQESPDGTRVYFARYLTAGAELWSMLPDGRDQHALEGMPKLALADEWVPAENGVYYIDAVAVPPTLNFFDLRTHRSHRIVNLQGLVNDWGAGPSLSSDGHTIVYAENDLVSGDIMLADGFR